MSRFNQQIYFCSQFSSAYSDLEPTELTLKALKPGITKLPQECCDSSLIFLALAYESNLPRHVNFSPNKSQVFDELQE